MALSKKKKIIFAVLALVVGLFLAFILAEISIRIFSPTKLEWFLENLSGQWSHT